MDLRRVARVDGDQVLLRLRVVVDGLNREEPAALLFERLLDQLALLPDQPLEGGALRVVDGLARRCRPGPVVVANAPEGAEAHRRGLPPAVERRPHRVQVDQLVGVDDRPVHLHVEAALGVAQVNELLRVLGVVAVEVVVAEPEHEIAAQEGLDLGAAQLPVQSLGAKQPDVLAVDSRREKLVDDQVDGHASEVGAPRSEVGAGRVVERDGDFGLRPDELAEGLVRYRVLDSVAHRRFDVGDGRTGPLCGYRARPLRELDGDSLVAVGDMFGACGCHHVRPCEYTGKDGVPHLMYNSRPPLGMFDRRVLFGLSGNPTAARSEALQSEAAGRPGACPTHADRCGPGGGCDNRGRQLPQSRGWGVTGVVAIAESHVSVHTWPVHAQAAVDILTCGPSLKPRLAADLIIEGLECAEAAVTEVRRGMVGETVAASLR